MKQIDNCGLIGRQTFSLWRQVSYLTSTIIHTTSQSEISPASMTLWEMEIKNSTKEIKGEYERLRKDERVEETRQPWKMWKRL